MSTYDFTKPGSHTFTEDYTGTNVPGCGIGRFQAGSTYTYHDAASSYKVKINGVTYHGEEAVAKEKEMRELLFGKKDEASHEAFAEEPAAAPSAVKAPSPEPYAGKAARPPSPVRESLPTNRSAYKQTWSTAAESGFVKDGVLRVGGKTTLYMGSGNRTSTFRVGPDGKMQRVYSDSGNFVGIM